MSAARLLSAMLLGIILVAGCSKPEVEGPVMFKDYAKQLPPGHLALRKLTDPADYPDFSNDFHNRPALLAAAESSLECLSKPSSENYFPYGEITHQWAVASLEHFAGLLETTGTSRELADAVVRDFDVYQSVGCDDYGTVFFTGYYCPIFDGRQERDDVFRYPLYRLPADLVKDEAGHTLGRRGADDTISPYPSRRTIEEQGLLAGSEIAWLKDPFEAYVVSVQGSAKLRLEDGSLLELGYAGNNGHEYTSVGRLMVDDGLLGAGSLSLQAMIRYFSEHPDDVPRYCRQNDRYIFFQEIPGGPWGSIGVPVLPYRSLATDKEVYPRACLAFLETRLPFLRDREVIMVPYSCFALDHDTGGAIRAAGRCDVFMGVGAKAEALAGRTGSEGKLYYLFLKPELLSE